MPLEIYRVTKDSPDWQKKAYDYVRTDAFVFGQGIPVETEFSHDSLEKNFQVLLLLEDHKPVAGARIQFPLPGVGKIGRVCVVREKQKSGYGRILLGEAEKWILEEGIRHIVINSQDRAAGFYLKLGYVENPAEDPEKYEAHEGAFVPRTEAEKAEHKKRMGFSNILVEKFF